LTKYLKDDIILLQLKHERKGRKMNRKRAPTWLLLLFVSAVICGMLVIPTLIGAKRAIGLPSSPWEKRVEVFFQLPGDE